MNSLTKSRTQVMSPTLTNVEKYLFYMFFAVAVLLLSSYLFFVQRSVFNIVARERAESEIGQLETKVATDEARYLAESGRQISTDYAHSIGFRDVTDRENYAVVENKTAVVFISGNEI